MPVEKFIEYCKEKKVFPLFLLEDQSWINNMNVLFGVIKKWYNSGGKEDFDSFLKQNIIIIDGITQAPEIKNCPECPSPEDHFKEVWRNKPVPKIVQIVERKMKNATGKRR